MAKIYKNRIYAKTVKFEDVPLNWKEQVKEMLKQDVTTEIITPEQYKEITGEDYLVR